MNVSLILSVVYQSRVSPIVQRHLFSATHSIHLHTACFRLFSFVHNTMNLNFDNKTKKKRNPPNILRYCLLHRWFSILSLQKCTARYCWQIENRCLIKVNCHLVRAKSKIRHHYRQREHPAMVLHHISDSRTSLRRLSIWMPAANKQLTMTAQLCIHCNRRCHRLHHQIRWVSQHIEIGEHCIEQMIQKMEKLFLFFKWEKINENCNFPSGIHFQFWFMSLFPMFFFFQCFLPFVRLLYLDELTFR